MGPFNRFSQLEPSLVTDLYRRAGADRWQLAQAEFGEALNRSTLSRFRDHPTSASEREIETYLNSLHIEDLALACACRHSRVSAWEHFVTNYRQVLYGAAISLARDVSRAEEIADSLFAELYGLEQREGHRRSPFEYFYGRSSLATWLRAIVAQRYVDGYRLARRDETIGQRALLEDGRARDPGDDDPDRLRYLIALDESLAVALAELEPRQRMMLSYYYLRQLTLAQIGRLMNEHESTISRKLDRMRRQLRKRVERILRREKHLSDEQIRLCYDYAVDDWPFDLTRALSDPE
jgi:RNA polymerase sigma-70 factor (ECF subfamily)